MAADPLRGPGAAPRPGPVVVTGAAGALGRRVTAGLRRAGVEPVVGLDVRRTPGGRRVDLLHDDLGPALAGAATVVHLASVFGPALDDDPAVERGDDVTAAQRLLDACGEAGVDHLVVLSSAVVYGAWPTNPLPLTEEATLRPGPDLAYAVQRAEVERRVRGWLTAHPGATATVLRPAPVVGGDGWLARALHAARRVADIEGDAPAQFLHVDDLASAVVLAVAARLDGVRNVAPDGWLRGSEYTALDAGTPKLRVPSEAGETVARWGWRLRLAPTPPGLLPYARHPWVVANDRLRADGWEPTSTNEEAFVAGTPATPLATLSPRRRQELALGLTGGALAAGAGAAVWAALRARAAR